MKKEQLSWTRIVLFFVVATVVSNIFRFDVFGFRPYFEQLPVLLSILVILALEGSGVIAAAWLCMALLRRQRSTNITLLGTSKFKGLMMAAIPVLVVMSIGVVNDAGVSEHIYGLAAIVGSLSYCIMEEYGWRGYLHEELRGVSPPVKYVSIGCIWYVWHLSFLTEATLGSNLFFLSMIILGSWGIGQVVEATKSVLASACFHLVIQIIMYNSFIKDGMGIVEKLGMLAVCVIAWFLIIKKWEKEQASEVF